MSLEENARIFIQRVRANEYSNESQLRFAFQTILPQIIGFGEALDFASGAETFEMSEDGRRLFFDTHYGKVIFNFHLLAPKFALLWYNLKSIVLNKYLKVLPTSLLLQAML